MNKGKKSLYDILKKTLLMEKLYTDYGNWKNENKSGHAATQTNEGTCVASLAKKNDNDKYRQYDPTPHETDDVTIRMSSSWKEHYRKCFFMALSLPLRFVFSLYSTLQNGIRFRTKVKETMEICFEIFAALLSRIHRHTLSDHRTVRTLARLFANWGKRMWQNTDAFRWHNMQPTLCSILDFGEFDKFSYSPWFQNLVQSTFHSWLLVCGRT